MKRLILFLSFVITTFSGIAQNCSHKLQSAQRAYLNGKFSEVVRLLQECSETFENVRDAQLSYELMINAHLLLDEQAAADKKMLELLTFFPLYQPRSTDLVEFRDLFSSYEIRKKWSFSLVAGLNVSDFEVMQYRSYASVTEEPGGYKSQIRPQLGLEVDYHILKKAYFSSGLLFQQSSYTQRERLLDFQLLDVQENFSYLKMPIQVGMNIDTEKHVAFIEGGLSFHYLLSSKADIQLFGDETEILTPLSGLSREVDGYVLSDQRSSWNVNYQVSGGIRRDFGLTAAEVSVVYEFGLNNLVDASQRYVDEELLSQYSYVPDDFKMNNFQFRVGLVRYIVEARKKKK